MNIVCIFLSLFTLDTVNILWWFHVGLITIYMMLTIVTFFGDFMDGNFYHCVHWLIVLCACLSAGVICIQYYSVLFPSSLQYFWQTFPAWVALLVVICFDTYFVCSGSSCWFLLCSSAVVSDSIYWICVSLHLVFSTYNKKRFWYYLAVHYGWVK